MGRAAFVILLAVLCLPWLNAQDRGDSDFSDEENRASTESQQNVTESLEPVVNGVMKRLARELYPLIEGILENQRVDSNCVNSLMKIIRGMQGLDFWAYSFVRSSGGLSSMLEGSATDLGMYDACLSSKATASNGDVMFSGKYCTLFMLVENEYVQKLLLQGMHHYKELEYYVHGDANIYFDYLRRLQPARIGVCIPSTCSGKDIESIIEGFGGKYGIKPSIPACRTLAEDPSLTSFQLLVVVIFALLVILCTVAGFMQREPRENSKIVHRSCAQEVLHCFSLRRNCSTAFNNCINSETRYLSCIHGLRAFSCIYVLWGHVYMLVDPFTIHYPMQAVRWLRHDISLVPLFMGFYVVDTFFCITGLIAFRALKLKFSEKQVPSIAAIILMSLVRRWVRLVIPSMAVILFFFLWPVFISGPTKDLVVDHLINGCAQNWWTIPAMVGNFYQMHHQCLLHLWYIGVDFQLMLVLLVPLILFVKPNTRRIGSIILFALAILSVTYVFAVTYISELPPILVPLPLFLDKLPVFVLKVYFSPISHIVSWIVGIFFSYLIEKHRDGRLNMPSRRSMSLLWIGIPIFCVVHYFVPFYWQTGADAFTVWAALYNGFSRGIWSFGVGWVVFTCATGYGGVVNKILSLPLLRPLSRISLSFYLVHIIVVATRTAQQRSLVEAQHYFVMKYALSDVIISFVFALLFFCLVEAPVANLDKLIFSSFTSRSGGNSIKPPKEHSLETIIVGENNLAFKDRL